MSRVIENVSELESLLAKLVHEAVEELEGDTGALERRRQKKMAANVSELESPDKKQEMEEAEDEEAEEETVEKEEVEVAADVEKPSERKVAHATTADIFKTLNVMRSGRSLKDPEVKNALKTYIEQLTTGEQQSLYAFLSGLAEMMVGGESGAVATDPGQAGIKVKPTEKAEDEEEVEIDIKKTVVKDEEEETVATPIVVGEVADKSSIRQRIRELWK
tara:strand:- start:1135 stop:1788 length:654 start_codon:yes stop_codon:yes gene_type:complete